MVPVGACFVDVAIGEPTSTAVTDKICSSNKITTPYVLYPKTCTVLKVKNGRGVSVHGMEACGGTDELLRLA